MEALTHLFDTKQEGGWENIWEDILDCETMSKGLGDDLEGITGIDENLFEPVSSSGVTDSEIDMNLCDVMITENDPVFNNMSHDSFGDRVKVVSMEMPDINPDEIQSRVEGHELFDDVQIGESEEVDMDKVLRL